MSITAESLRESAKKGDVTTCDVTTLSGRKLTGAEIEGLGGEHLRQPLTLGERRIRDAANYINRRIANMEAGKAWLDVGRELSELKVFLAKHSKSDKRDGWLAAFAKDKSPFAFSRQHADTLIVIHERIGASALAHKNLPASLRALTALSRLPDSHRETVIAKCQPGTTEREVGSCAREAGYHPKAKTSPTREQHPASADDHHDGDHVSISLRSPKRAAKEIACRFSIDDIQIIVAELTAHVERQQAEAREKFRMHQERNRAPTLCAQGGAGAAISTPPATAVSPKSQVKSRQTPRSSDADTTAVLAETVGKALFGAPGPYERKLIAEAQAKKARGAS